MTSCYLRNHTHKTTHIPTNNSLQHGCGEIVEGVQVLRQGFLIHGIGSGETTRIWETPWLCKGWHDATVVLGEGNELIDQTSQRWDRQILREFFSPMDWEIIDDIPLSTTL